MILSGRIPTSLAVLIVFGCGVDDRDVGIADAQTAARGGADAAADGATGGSANVTGVPSGGQGGSAGTSSETGPEPSELAQGGASGASSGGSGSEVAGNGGAGGGETVGTASCGEQLLQNGDFDLGPINWQELSTVRDIIVHRDDPDLVAAGITPHSGDYVAWLGGIENGDFGKKFPTTLIQRVQIPADAQTLIVTGYAWVRQPDLGSMPFDWMVLELMDPGVDDGTYNGNWQIKTWGDADVSTNWVRFEAITERLEDIRGLPRDVIADSRPDSSGSMNMWLDSLTLEARCPR